jgi:hypothetical protein
VNLLYTLDDSIPPAAFGSSVHWSTLFLSFFNGKTRNQQFKLNTVQKTQRHRCHFPWDDVTWSTNRRSKMPEYIKPIRLSVQFSCCQEEGDLWRSHTNSHLQHRTATFFKRSTGHTNRHMNSWPHNATWYDYQIQNSAPIYNISPFKTFILCTAVAIKKNKHECLGAANINA